MNNDPNSGSSLYVHLPFCVRKCRYCDFYSTAVGDGAAAIIYDYIVALGEEWESYRDDEILSNPAINTIYIGGGTPSIINIDMWKRLDDALFSQIDKSKIIEWSVECNPESFTMEKASVYAKSGVTRLTFGVQSMNGRELSICGRAHSAERAIEVLKDERLGDMFRSIGVDIIYALPGQTVNTLDDTLSRILSIPHIKHLSAYELTIADGTPFGRHQKILKLPGDDIVVEMYGLINKRCAERGMAQYEVSNYALPGYESAHNKAYWSHSPYIGLGASAHSYIHPKRWSNVNDIDQYISRISTRRGGNLPPAVDPTNQCMPSLPSFPNIAADFEEMLTSCNLAREMLFLGLRNISGVNNNDISSRTGVSINNDRLQKYVDDGLLLQKSNGRYVPTSRGMLFADMMARDLME